MPTRIFLAAVLLPMAVLLISCVPTRPTASEPPAAAPPAIAQNQPETRDRKPGTDLYGDPLPPGAIARMGTVRLRDRGLIMSLAFSPDGRVLATGGVGMIR